jgi:hypothetical protein
LQDLSPVFPPLFTPPFRAFLRLFSPNFSPKFVPKFSGAKSDGFEPRHSTDKKVSFPLPLRLATQENGYTFGPFFIKQCYELRNNEGVPQARDDEKPQLPYNELVVHVDIGTLEQRMFRKCSASVTKGKRMSTVRPRINMSIRAVASVLECLDEKIQFYGYTLRKLC